MFWFLFLPASCSVPSTSNMLQNKLDNVASLAYVVQGHASWEKALKTRSKASWRQHPHRMGKMLASHYASHALPASTIKLAIIDYEATHDESAESLYHTYKATPSLWNGLTQHNSIEKAVVLRHALMSKELHPSSTHRQSLSLHLCIAAGAFFATWTFFAVCSKLCPLDCISLDPTSDM